MEIEVTDQQKIFANNLSDNGFVSKICIKLLKLNLKIHIVQLKIGKKHAVSFYQRRYIDGK